ncbi:hypothetical protein [Pedococcus sp. 2YAF34]|uniref:hypothetical protein n=1 Tax=Pedococcus sp. 2YAF34 TaxID=3233032 RepID=UPI003F9D5474
MSSGPSEGGAPAAAPHDAPVPPSTLAETLQRSYTRIVLSLVVGAGAAMAVFPLGLAAGADPLAAFVVGLLVFGASVLVATAWVGTALWRGQRRSGPVFVVAVALVVLVVSTFETTGLIWVIGLLVPLLAALAGRWSLVSGRRALPAVTAIGVLAAMLSLDVWLGERVEVEHVLRDVRTAGVTVWVPTGDDPSCEPRYVTSTGPGVLRYSWWCDGVRGGYVDVSLTNDPSKPDSPVPSVRRQPEGSSSFSMVATTVRSGVVLEVRHVGIGREDRAERLAGSMAEVSPTWLASRGLPLHQLALRTGLWGSAAPRRA